ncbi:MAG: type III-B CRISPR module-associated protein Cmr5 [Rhodospirillales bacterium]|nr:MAG: type III-B CRISPR module-associated protein Cmr5 [Rhodospirillales bacterium]
MSPRSLDQERARHALDQIRILEQRGTPGKYVSYVKALPAAILANGLGQALATELATQDAAHKKLVEQVTDWLRQAPSSPFSQCMTPKDLLESIFQSDQRAYVWAQAEAIAYIGWLKKLAVAFLDGPASENTKAAGDGG